MCFAKLQNKRSGGSSHFAGKFIIILPLSRAENGKAVWCSFRTQKNPDYYRIKGWKSQRPKNTRDWSWNLSVMKVLRCIQQREIKKRDPANYLTSPELECYQWETRLLKTFACNLIWPSSRTCMDIFLTLKSKEVFLFREQLLKLVGHAENNWWCLFSCCQTLLFRLHARLLSTFYQGEGKLAQVSL